MGHEAGRVHLLLNGALGLEVRNSPVTNLTIGQVQCIRGLHEEAVATSIGGLQDGTFLMRGVLQQMRSLEVGTKAHRVWNKSKLNHKDDQYMCMTNTLLWVAKYQRMRERERELYHKFIANINNTLRRRVLLRESQQQQVTPIAADARPPLPPPPPLMMLQRLAKALDTDTVWCVVHYLGVASASMRAIAVAKSMVYRTILTLWDEGEVLHDQRARCYSVRKGNRVRAVKQCEKEELIRKVLLPMANDGDERDKLLSRLKSDFSTPVRVIWVTNSDRKQWIPTKCSNPSDVDEISLMMRRVLHVVTSVQLFYGTNHPAWAETGNSACMGVVLQQCINQLEGVYQGGLVPRDVYTCVPKTSRSAFEYDTHPAWRGVLCDELFQVYFVLCGYHCSLTSVYQTHREHVILAIQATEATETGPGGLYRILCRVRLYKRVSHNAILRHLLEDGAVFEAAIERMPPPGTTDSYLICMDT